MGSTGCARHLRGQKRAKHQGGSGQLTQVVYRMDRESTGGGKNERNRAGLSPARFAGAKVLLWRRYFIDICFRNCAAFRAAVGSGADVEGLVSRWPKGSIGQMNLEIRWEQIGRERRVARVKHF